MTFNRVWNKDSQAGMGRGVIYQQQRDSLNRAILPWSMRLCIIQAGHWHCCR